MRRITLITHNYPYGLGETFLETEIKYLAKGFDEILIIPLIKEKSGIKRSVPANVTVLDPVLSANKLNRLFKGIFNISPAVIFLKELFQRKAYKKLKWFIKWTIATLDMRNLLSNNKLMGFLEKASYESLIYFYWGNPRTMLSYFMKRKNRKAKIICRFHGYDLYEEREGGYIPFREHIIKSLGTAIFVSEAGKKYALEHYREYGLNKKNTIVFKLGVEKFTKNKPSEDGIFRIVSCSGIRKVKRLQLVVQALQKINEVQIEWTHIGDGKDRNRIIKEIKKLPKNIKVRLTGWISNSEVKKYYKNNRVDLFINTSSSEGGMPVSIMEALSAGIPVIATAVGGTPELVDDNVGKLLRDNPSPEEIAEAIRQMAKMKRREMMKLRRNAERRWKERADADKNYKKFVKYLKGKGLKE